MTLPREQHVKRISDHLNLLAEMVKTRARASLTAANRVLETIAARFFDDAWPKTLRLEKPRPHILTLGAKWAAWIAPRTALSSGRAKSWSPLKPMWAGRCSTPAPARVLAQPHTRPGAARQGRCRGCRCRPRPSGVLPALRLRARVTPQRDLSVEGPGRGVQRAASFGMVLIWDAETLAGVPDVARYRAEFDESV
jgi:hypothetical protein